MAADGRRKTLIIAIRDAIRSIDGTAEYFNDLSGNYICQLGRESLGSLSEYPDPITVRVYDGLDSQDWRQSFEIEAELEVILFVQIRDTVGTLVERLNDVIADIELAIGKRRGAGGECSTIRIRSIDPPNYNFDKELAIVIFRIAAIYNFTAGVDR